jgi:hypothetical protein
LKSDDHVNDVVDNESTEAEQAAVAKNLKETLKDEAEEHSSENALHKLKLKKLRIQRHPNILMIVK